MTALLAAIGGAIIAVLADRYIAARLHGAYTIRRLARSFIEELCAVEFTTDPANPPPRFAGFSSQTFDSFFAQLAQWMPDRYLVPLMRYHWRMKFLDDIRRRSAEQQRAIYVDPDSIDEMAALRDSPLELMQECANTYILDLAFWPTKLEQEG